MTMSPNYLNTDAKQLKMLKRSLTPWCAVEDAKEPRMDNAGVLLLNVNATSAANAID